MWENLWTINDYSTCFANITNGSSFETGWFAYDFYMSQVETFKLRVSFIITELQTQFGGPSTLLFITLINK